MKRKRIHGPGDALRELPPRPHVLQLRLHGVEGVVPGGLASGNRPTG